MKYLSNLFLTAVFVLGSFVTTSTYAASPSDNTNNNNTNTNNTNTNNRNINSNSLKKAEFQIDYSNDKFILNKEIIREFIDQVLVKSVVIGEKSKSVPNKEAAKRQAVDENLNHLAGKLQKLLQLKESAFIEANSKGSHSITAQEYAVVNFKTARFLVERLYMSYNETERWSAAANLKQLLYVIKDVQPGQRLTEHQEMKMNQIIENNRNVFIPLDIIEDARYINELTSKNQDALRMFSEILVSEMENKDVQKLRRVLKKVGLPPQAHQDSLLRQLLMALKEKRATYMEARDMDARQVVRSNSLYHNFDGLLALRNTLDKQYLDSLQYQNRFLNTVKGFPLQFIVFTAAVGASTYREYMTDPLVYGASKNPEMLNQFMQLTLSPSQMFSFFVFIAASSQTNYRLYKAGVKFDAKGLGFLRTLGSPLGLASGLFASQLFHKVVDSPHLKRCAKSLANKELRETENTYNHKQSCEQAYQEWSSEKWAHLGMDAGLMITASILSHKMVEYSLLLLRSNSSTASMVMSVSRAIGPRVIGLAGFFISLYLFLETHNLLDRLIGTKLKTMYDSYTLGNSMDNLSHTLDQAKTINNDSLLKAYVKDTIKKVKGFGQELKKWSDFRLTDYQMAFSGWMQKINKVALTYEYSPSLLRNLYSSSQAPYDFIPTLYNAHDNFQAQQKGFIIEQSTFTEHFHATEGNAGTVIFKDSICSIYNLEINHPTLHVAFCNKAQDPDTVDWSSKKFLLDFSRLLLAGVPVANSISPKEISCIVSKKPEELFSYHAQNSQNAQGSKCKVNYSNYSNKATLIYQLLQAFLNANKDETATIKEFKYLATAVYLVQQNKTQNPSIAGTGVLVSTLLRYFKVYKKGDRYFYKDVEKLYSTLDSKVVSNFQSNKEITQLFDYQYAFFQGLICNDNPSPRGAYFQAPKIINGFESLCLGSKLDHEALFDKPVQVKGKKYENLWMALEQSVATKFKTPTDFLNAFYDKATPQTEEIMNEIHQDLAQLNTSLLLPAMINQDQKVASIQTCEQILSYYGKQDGQSFTFEKLQGLSGLETSLVRIIYWLRQLEKISDYHIEEACDSLELLKNYHDRYLQAQASYIKVPTLKEIMEQDLVKDMYYENDSCVYRCDYWLADEAASELKKCKEECFSDNKQALGKAAIFCNHKQANQYNDQDVSNICESDKSEEEIVIAVKNSSLNDLCNGQLNTAITNGNTYSCFDSLYEIPLVSIQHLAPPFLGSLAGKYLGQLNNRFFEQNLKPKEIDVTSLEYLEYSIVFELHESIRDLFMQLQFLTLVETTENRLSP